VREHRFAGTGTRGKFRHDVVLRDTMTIAHDAPARSIADRRRSGRRQQLRSHARDIFPGDEPIAQPGFGRHIAGQPDGNQTARISLGAVDPAELRRAWLLTSQDSFARIDSWTEILQSRIGALTHEEAGRVTISDPTSQDKTKTIEVTVWRPKR